MRYLKIILFLVLAMVVVMAVIWLGFIVLLVSVIIAPFILFFMKKKGKVPQNTKTRDEKYKVIDAEYKIIDDD